MFDVTVFGATTVDPGDGRIVTDLGGAKPRQILEILALASGAPVSKERLADLLWEREPPRSYLATLESYVCLLRRQIGSPGRISVVRTMAKGYALDTTRVRVDLARVRSMLATAHSTADPALAVGITEEALTLARHELLASEHNADWAIRERDVFARELVEACVRASEHALALGQHSRAVTLARRGVELDGLAEEAWRQLMSALVSSDRRGEALQAFADLRALLADELGVEPTRSSHELYLRILRDASSPESGAERDSAELRTLLLLLRRALDSTPGVVVPRGDSALSFAAVQVLAVA